VHEHLEFSGDAGNGSAIFCITGKEIPMTFESQHISVSISCSAIQVYEFASNPENLPPMGGRTQRFHKERRW